MEPEIVKKRFIETSSFYKNSHNSDPFSSMKIDDSSFLDEVPTRSVCAKCHRSRKYYCYTCYIPVEEVASRLPALELPIKIDIIKHSKEVDGKSTSAHAAILAPHDVKIYTYPEFPCYDDQKVLLIFPGKTAIPFQDWWYSQLELRNKDTLEKPMKDEKCTLPFTKVVFIDSTWRQSKSLYSDPRIKNLPCILLSSYKSLFWRYYREKLDTHLSTIEAVYYFLVELHNLASPGTPYRGQYDNLLFFFRFMYFKIRTWYDPLKIKAYQENETVQSDSSEISS